MPELSPLCHPAPAVGSVWEFRKTKHRYVVRGYVRDATNGNPTEGAWLVRYARWDAPSEEWARAVPEFMDGRFKACP